MRLMPACSTWSKDLMLLCLVCLWCCRLRGGPSHLNPCVWAKAVDGWREGAGHLLLGRQPGWREEGRGDYICILLLLPLFLLSGRRLGNSKVSIIAWCFSLSRMCPMFSQRSSTVDTHLIIYIEIVSWSSKNCCLTSVKACYSLFLPSEVSIRVLKNVIHNFCINGPVQESSGTVV